MSDTEDDVSSLLEDLEALNVCQDRDAASWLQENYNPMPKVSKSAHLTHNCTTELKISARASARDPSITTSPRKRKGFMDLPGEYREISIKDNEEDRPLAIFDVSRQVRREFLTSWLSRIGIDASNDMTILASSTVSSNLPVLITTHIVFSSFQQLLVNASYRAQHDDDGARISFKFGRWIGTKLTPGSKDRIAMTMSEIFQTNNDITLEKFLIATDRIFALSLEALVLLCRRDARSCFHTMFNVEKARSGEVPEFLTQD